MRSGFLTAANSVLRRAGLALVRASDVEQLEWISEKTLKIPLPDRPLCDGVACLRPLRPSDAVPMAEAAADPDVAHFGLWPSPFSVADARRWITEVEAGRRAGQVFALAVLDAETKRFCGVVGVERISLGRLTAEQFQWLAAEARGKRMGVSVTLLLDRWIFENTSVSRMEAVTLVDNVASITSLRRKGYTQEGVLRGGLVHYGRRHDAALYALLRPDLDPAETDSHGEATAGAHRPTPDR